MVDYVQIYRELGFQIEPLCDGYTPDAYAKKLMQNVQAPEGVVYAVSTNIYSNENSTSLNKSKAKRY